MDRDRGGFKGLRIIAFAMAFLAGGALADVPETLPADPAPIDLSKDDAYRRDGVLVDMKTCLALADDRLVHELLNHRFIKNALNNSAVERVDAIVGTDSKLRADQLELRDNPGYGTVLACAQIVAAWSSRNIYADGNGRFSAGTSPVSPDDGRIKHGSLVIDLSLQPRDDRSRSPANRAFVEPEALARLLTTPGLVPAKIYGGVIFKNAIVNGPLVLNNIRLTTPVAFINVRFAGRSYPQNVVEIDERVPATALAISSARLEDQLLFAGSEFCGNVNIDQSRFADSLTFRDVKQFAVGCWGRGNGQSPVKLTIEGSHFEQGLAFERSDFVSTDIEGVTADSLAADRVSFGSRLSIEEGDFGALAFECSTLAAETSIKRNRIDKQLLIEGIDTARRRNGEVKDTACHDWWRSGGGRLRTETASLLTVDDNQIGGRLHIDHLRGSDIEAPLRLTNNRVSGRSRVVMPSPDPRGQQWSGDVSFVGSTYDGNLEIRHSAVEADSQTANSAETGYCGTTRKTDDPEWTNIVLNVTRIRTLIWNLPFTCDYRWHAHGLTYDLWLSGDFAKHSLAAKVADKDKVDFDHMALMKWRTALKRYDPSPLITLSAYLAAQGQYVESRRILYEAKRLNYALDCRPDAWVLRCLWQMVAGDAGSSAVAAQADDGDPVDRAEPEASNAAVEDETERTFSAWFSDAMGWLTRFGMLILLWPGGYGASPEWALVLLVLLFLGCWIIYGLYTRAMRRQLIEEWSHIRDFLDENLDLIARSRMAVTQPGLGEAQASFDFEKQIIGQVETHWIARTTWLDDMSDEDRLREIQGPLLAKVKAWEAGASGSALKTFQGFRQRLARFGNTETAGFDRFDGNKMPKRFTERLYAFDTMLPVIDLHAYSNYYPIAGWARMLSVLQHICGWWWITVFIASAAIL